MHGYWEHAFWPLWPPALRGVVWPAAAMRDVLSDVATLPWPKLALVPLALGALHLIRVNRPLAALVLLPMCAAAAASAFKLYPFSNRTLFFLLPAIALLLGFGFEAMFNAAVHGRRATISSIVAILAAARIGHVVIANPPPYVFLHIRPVLADVGAASRPGDQFVVTYGAEQAWRYYAARFGLDNRPTIFLACRRGPASGYVQDISALDSGRVWLIQSMAARIQTAALLVHALGQRGEQLTVFPPGATGTRVSAHLFDLNASPTVSASTPPPVIDLDPPGPCQGPAVVRPPLP
jgi:hypothetical protein